MDQVFPDTSFGPGPRPAATRRGARHSVVTGDRRLPVVELKRDGFVIAAEHEPRLRGFVDIMRGRKRLARRLVVCAWADRGLIGYEFKRDCLTAPISPDHAPISADRTPHDPDRDAPAG